MSILIEGSGARRRREAERAPPAASKLRAVEAERRHTPADRLFRSRARRGTAAADTSPPRRQQRRSARSCRRPSRTRRDRARHAGPRASSRSAWNHEPRRRYRAEQQRQLLRRSRGGDSLVAGSDDIPQHGHRKAGDRSAVHNAGAGRGRPTDPSPPSLSSVASTRSRMRYVPSTVVGMRVTSGPGSTARPVGWKKHVESLQLGVATLGSACLGRQCCFGEEIVGRRPLVTGKHDLPSTANRPVPLYAMSALSGGTVSSRSTNNTGLCTSKVTATSVSANGTRAPPPASRQVTATYSSGPHRSSSRIA